MTALNVGIETLGGVKPERIVWLPTITLGYIYTLSGALADFALAVIAIGAARFFVDLIQAEAEVNELAEGWQDVMTGRSDSNSSTLMIWFFGLLIASYALAAGRSVWRLYAYFTHTDLILVGIAAIHWGIFIVLLTNLVSLFAGTPFDDSVTEGDSTPRGFDQGYGEPPN